MTITPTTFLRVQRIFLEKINESNFECKVIVTDKTAITSFGSFVGDNPRIDTIEHTIKCMHAGQSLSDFTRTNYGVDTDATISLTVSGKHIAEKFGHWRFLHKNINGTNNGIPITKVRVEYRGKVYRINNVRYLEPFVDDQCIGLVLELSDSASDRHNP